MKACLAQKLTFPWGKKDFSCLTGFTRDIGFLLPSDLIWNTDSSRIWSLVAFVLELNHQFSWLSGSQPCARSLWGAMGSPVSSPCWLAPCRSWVSFPNHMSQSLLINLFQYMYILKYIYRYPVGSVSMENPD